jgi:glycosyltransferase involved in cell wall biosynthesis
MNITLLTTSFPEYQGDLAGIFVAYLAQELVRQSLHVRVIAPHSPATSRYELFDTIPIYRFQYFYPAIWQRVSYGYGIPANLKTSFLAKIGLPFFLISFAREVLRHRHLTDLYHAQWIFSGVVAVAGQKIHGKPVVLTIRGSDLNLVRGKFLTSLVTSIFHRVAMITTVSEALREKVLGLGVPPEKVQTIPNGINCRIFQPLPKEKIRHQLHLPLDHKVILWVGRFVAIKGVEFLIQAIPEVLAKEPKALFILIGHGDCEEQIKRLVQQKGVTQVVKFTGKIPSEHIPLWMNAADILVLPSLNEGRPNVVLEAMACEVPVVATNVGGIPEIVKEGENGFLVPPEDIPQLAKQLIKLLQDVSLRSTMGKIGRQMLFKMGLSWEQCAEKMKSVYQQAVNSEQ